MSNKNVVTSLSSDWDWAWGLGLEMGMEIESTPTPSPRRLQYNARGHHHHPPPHIAFNHEGVLFEKSAFRCLRWTATVTTWGNPT